LLANEGSAVATHEQVAQFTVAFWRFLSLEKEVFSLCSGCFPSKWRFNFDDFILEHIVA